MIPTNVRFCSSALLHRNKSTFTGVERRVPTWWSTRRLFWRGKTLQAQGTDSADKHRAVKHNDFHGSEDAAMLSLYYQKYSSFSLHTSHSRSVGLMWCRPTVSSSNSFNPSGQTQVLGVFMGIFDRRSWRSDTDDGWEGPAHSLC